MSDGITVHVSASKRRLIYETLRSRLVFISKVIAGYDAVPNSSPGQDVRQRLFVDEIAEIAELLVVFDPET